METHLYGVFYTIIYVLLCRMFIETFEEKRNISKKYIEMAHGYA